MSRTNPAEQQGFTLVEVMVALLVGGLVMAAVMTSFRGQHATYLHQEQAAEMQQNLRVALSMLNRDIRSAGFDPERVGAGISTADPDVLIFTRAKEDDHDELEFIRYQTYTAYEGTHRERDALSRSQEDDESSLTNSAVAEYIENLEFHYLDAEGNPTTEIDDIRKVTVSLLVRAANQDTGYTHTEEYTTASGGVWGLYEDGYRRRMQTQTIKFRNLGLE